MDNLVYADNPTLAFIPKGSDFGGKYKPIPIITGVSQGRSSLFVNAQGNQSPVQMQSFLLTRATDYSIATIDNQTLLASKTDKMSFIEGSKVVIDGAIQALTLSLASAMFRSGTGSIGQISGSVSSGVITLTDPNSVVQFELNQVLQANATDGGATPRSALGYVVAVNRSGGTITVSTSMGGAPASPASWSSTDFLLVQGDLNAKIAGFAAWLPATAPTSTDLFFGVNRSADTWRLGGGRYGYNSSGVNVANQSIEEGLIDASSLLAREGGKPTHCPMNYASWAGFEKGLGAKVQYIDMKGPGRLVSEAS